jgi:hypothetical protein
MILSKSLTTQIIRYGRNLSIKKSLKIPKG